MKKLLYFIIVVSFIDTFIQLPIITPYAKSLGASHMLTGAIVAVYSLTNMFGNILGGHWIDKYGRKRMLFIGMISVTVILLLYPLAATGFQLFIIRLLHGLAGGFLIPSAFAYVGDQTRAGSRGKAMAFTGAAIGIAAIVGPAVGGALAARGQIEYVFILVAGLFLFTSFLVLRYIEESFVSRDRSKVHVKHFIPLLKNPLLLQASLAAFGLMISNGTLAFALPLKVEAIGLDASATGALLSTFGIMAIIVFLTPINKIYDHTEPLILVGTGIFIIGSAMLLLSYVTMFWTGILTMIVYGIGFAFVFPSMNRMVTESSSKIDRGKAYGIFYAFFSLGVVAGSSVSGAIAEWWGIPFIFTAIVMFIICTTLYVIDRVRKKLRIHL
ncbi:MFS transporter [Virgibacillus pantothenticus]|uniref:MFS transporter n=1 Tax=Virgibacillus pantothenticus TaxID=1473 RepID=UPI001C24ADEB|nr:MFS transporter [Virgibacillus pantothenticus]MBU8564989.1 MFS transporter [Virgibacillus pantothenticus]MBU8599296.1 MFS transporter [Virgibacillus pantothenticus]MBU8633301.1 MFS transporter [Virgibacillus pantothenticus]MBU8641038.1 MFS transporter [Virgibacillus pantothenticus]MBU8645033.1 MFS transporter [Virgibacillus pantothenticus]